MRRYMTGWYSERLYLEMPLVAYGHAGFPILMLPTAATDFLEYERFHLIGAIKPFIDRGLVRVYSVNSVNRQSLLNQDTPPHLKIEYIERYDRYLIHEVLPFIRHDCGDPNWATAEVAPTATLPLIAGISLGGYLAANTFFKHPDQFAGTILLSGTYNIRNFLDGYYNETVYFNNPADFLPNLNDDNHLPILQHGSRQIMLFSGQGEHEDPSGTRHLSEILSRKGIPHELDLWGHDVNHDWPWWRQAFPYYLGRFLG